MAEFFRLLGIVGLGAGIALIAIAWRMDVMVEPPELGAISNLQLMHFQLLIFLAGALGFLSGVISLAAGSLLEAAKAPNHAVTHGI